MSVIKAKDHEMYITYSVVAFLIPLVGFILGIVFMSKDQAKDRKLGEHLLIFSIVSVFIWWIILATFTGDLFSTPETYGLGV